MENSCIIFKKFIIIICEQMHFLETFTNSPVGGCTTAPEMLGSIHSPMAAESITRYSVLGG